MQTRNIHYRAMGRRFRVTAIIRGTAAANRYMQAHETEGVIAVHGQIAFMADVRDGGTETQERMDIWDHCEVCGRRQESCWPVAIDGDGQNIRMLCDGCAAMDLNAAWVIDLLEQDQRKN